MGERRSSSGHDFANITISGDARAQLGNSYTVSKDEAQVHFFKTSNYESYKDFNPLRVPGTCKWFLEHPTYIRWQQSGGNDLLWLSADPGCGKSVLSRMLVDERLLCGKTASICYFFFKDNLEQNNVSTAICALLHQLFCGKSPLFQKYALPAIEKNGEELKNDVEELWRLLIGAATDYEAEHVICVLDALDECMQDERNKLIRMLEDFHTAYGCHSTSRSSLKLFVTSRPYQGIEYLFSRLIRAIPTIRLAGEEESEAISREIEIVIKARVNELARDLGLNEAIESALETRLLKTTNRTYLWLKLVLDEISKALGRTTKKLLKVIEELPQTVEQAYEMLLAKCLEKEHARKVLQIIVAAERPLDVKEMDVALEIRPGSKSYDDLDLEGEGNRKTHLRNLCGLFVSVVDSKIYLIHQTAKEFLIAWTVGHSKVERWKHSLDIRSCHRILAEICMVYLLFHEFRGSLPIKQKLLEIANLDEEVHTGDLDLQNHLANDVPFTSKFSERVVELDEQRGRYFKHQSQAYLAEKVFLEYSANNWSTHFRRAETGIADHLTTLASKLCDIMTDTGKWPIWIDMIDTYSHRNYLDALFYKRPSIVSKLKEPFHRWLTIYFHALIGLLRVVRLLLRMGVVLNGTTLQAAAAVGNMEVVRLLMQKNVDVNAKGGPYGNALQAAAAFGHTEMAQLLIQANANTNAQGGIFGTALQAAAAAGHQGVVQVLIQAKADVNALGGYYGDALQAATENKHSEVKELLINASGNVNARGGVYGSASYAATAPDNEHIAQLLIHDITNGSPMSRNDAAALHAAVLTEDESRVYYLFQIAAKVTVRSDFWGRNEDKLYGSMLSAAVRSGNQRIVRHLLRTKRDVNVRSKYYSLKLDRTVKCSALYVGIERRKARMVELLLKAGADVHMRCSPLGTALQSALWHGYEDIVDQLKTWIRISHADKQCIGVKRLAESSNPNQAVNRNTRQRLD